MRIPAEPVKKMFFPSVTSFKISCCSALRTILAAIEMTAGLKVVGCENSPPAIMGDTTAWVVFTVSARPTRFAGGSNEEDSDSRFTPAIGTGGSSELESDF